MLFSDPVFFAFFAIYFVFHFSVAPCLRVYLIILGSTVFYAYWRVEYIWLPYLLTIITWTGARWMGAATGARERKLRLSVTLVSLFLPLAGFKYAHFFVSDVIGAVPSVASGLGNVAWLKVALPLAISFVTFTLTAYLVDLYRNRCTPEKGVATLLAYVLFFPHLIAGPILRPRELMPQLRMPRSARDASFVLGAALFALGLVKKLVFADTIAGVVDDVFARGAAPTRLEYLLAIYGYSMQIYCDFSGYTDMAIGLAYLLGVRLPRNFMRPYSAHSIVEFWRRWHITLSFWLRDYLYVPLGGNRHGRYRQLVSVMITMVLGGLWHGANWTFLVWGCLHGVALAAVHGLSSGVGRFVIPRWISILLTFNFVSLAWVIFRSPDLGTAHRVLAGPILADTGDIAGFASRYAFELVLLTLFFATHWLDQHARVRLLIRDRNRGLVPVLVALAFLFAVTVSQGSTAKFIYFDF
jgi:alginate O-acetyltransferase complex protein AlgI